MDDLNLNEIELNTNLINQSLDEEDNDNFPFSKGNDKDLQPIIPKMWGVLRTRDNVHVTKMNVFTMVWLAFVSSMCLGW